MCEKSGYCYSDTCARMRTQMESIRGDLRIAENNKAQRESYTAKKKKHEENIVICNRIIEATKPLTSRIKEYLAEKKDEALIGVNNALRLSGEIIPDSMAGIRFAIDKEDASIVSEDGCDIQIMEGGGFRQVSSAFIRHVILSTAPTYLQTMFFDEVFALVNQENSATLSTYLQLICKNQQVISIEQKGEVYLNMNYTAYTFRKNEKFSTVERKEYVNVQS